MSPSSFDLASSEGGLARTGDGRPDTSTSTSTSTSSRRRARLQLTVSVLALALAALPAPSMAQQTGGNGGGLASGTGGAGGTTNPTDGTATAGGDGDSSSGGGGGGGAGGGKGGDGPAGAGGAGGASPGADGSNGVTATIASGGGGGGAHGATTLPAAAPVRGGRGGHGGDAIISGGGGGGGGGYGVFVLDPAFSGTLTQAVAGGDGGNGGNVNAAGGRGPGAGGSGGVGVFFAGAGTLINQATIRGGNGGNNGGAGGAGVVGANLVIDNTAGVISGGVSGDGGAIRANAITFTGGLNSLTLAGTGGLIGNIGIAAGSLVTFDQSMPVTLENVITGAGGVVQNGVGTLMLTGDNTYGGGTTISTGTLQIGNRGTTGMIAGNVTNNAMLAFARADTVGFGGVIAGRGAVTQNGPGILALTGTNTYTGGTTITGGTLMIGGAFTTGSIVGDVTNNAVLAFNRSDALTFGGVISGRGRVDQIGAGTTVLTGANTYTGETFITRGTLQIGDGNTTGAISGHVTNDATLAFNRSDTVVFGSAISGSGRVNQVGTGSTVLTGANTYAGGTTITAGILQIGLGGTTGAISGNVTNNATFVFSRSDEATFGGVISGSGVVNQIGTGTTVLTGANTYSGTTGIVFGTLQIGNGGTTGAIAGNVLNNATLAFNRSDAVTFGGVISGSGAVNQVGTGTTVLTGANTYAGETTISAGVLNIRHAAALGDTAVGTTVASGAALQIQGGITVGAEALTLNGAGIANDGALRSMLGTGVNTYRGSIRLGSASRINSDAGVLDLRAAATIAGTNTDLSFGGAGTIQVQGTIDLGTGSLTKDGSGELFLFGSSRFSGATTINGGSILVYDGSALNDKIAVTINSGALKLRNSVDIGSLTGAGTVAMSDGIRLTTGADNASTTFSGVIESPFGVSGLTKTGTGTLTLTGANTYAGATTINGGDLRVNGSLVSAVTVANGGTLSGTGTINNAVTVQNGGTLSAGQSPGTLTVNALTLNTGSTTVFELGAAGVVGGISNDLVNVANNLTLGGTLSVNAPSAGYYRLFNYGTLTSGSSFSAVTGSAGLTPTVLTNIAGQVNLLIAGAGKQVQFWDGADATGNGTVDGGSGTWSAANTNWTGAPGQAGINDQWRSSVGVFAGTGGTVMLVGAQSFDTLQFSADGYILGADTGGQLRLAGASNTGTINVDGGVTARINTQINDGTATGLIKVGAGTLVLAGPSTYSGETLIAGGVVNVQHATALGSTAGGTTVASGAALQMQGDITVNGEALTLNGTGVNNDGALRNISGNNEFRGVITLGSASRINSDSGMLDLRRIVGSNHDVIFGGAGAIWADGGISTGTGGLTKEGTGIMYLLGRNTYTGTTTINGGELRIADGDAIADTGAVVVSAGGRLGVTAKETIGSLAGDGAVFIWNGRTLTVGGADTSTVFSGRIAEAFGISGLTKIGTGTQTLAGTNTYTGTTTVNGGTLSVNGSIASSSMTTVNAGGTLAGTGTVGHTTIDGGTLAPGNSIGTLNVRGNLVMTAAATYMVEVSPAAADRVDVTGTATLGGATVNASFAPGSYIAKTYTIVNAAGGVTGRFGTQVNTDLPSNFKSGLSYDANNAYLDLALDFVPEPPPGPTPPAYRPLTANQAAVGHALVGYFNRTGGIPLVFGALDAKGLSQVAGELGTGSQQTTFDAMTMFMGVMTDPFANGRSDAPGALGFAEASDAFAMFTKAPPKAYEARWNVWAAGFGGSQTTDGNAATGSSNSKSSIYGMAAGADYWFSPFTVAGVSMAGGGTNFSVNGGGAGRSDLFQVGGFVRHAVGATYVTAAAAYGWQGITTDRTVTVAGFDQLRASFGAHGYSGRIEAGHRVALPWIGGFGLTPYVAAQVTALDLPAYAESVVGGSDRFALAYAGKTAIAPRSELGFRTDKSFAIDDAILTLRGRAAWAHDINRDRSASATFQSLPGASFVVNGAALAKHTALTSASAELKWMNGWSIAGTFDGEFSDVTTSFAGRGVVRYAW